MQHVTKRLNCVPATALRGFRIGYRAAAAALARSVIHEHRTVTPVYIYISLFSLSLGCQLGCIVYVSCALDPALELRVARVSRLSGLRRAPSGARDGPTTHTETRPCQNVKPGTRNPKLSS
jgi:hypothetical protein